jgi:alpha-L-arabinofuranosidase
MRKESRYNLKQIVLACCTVHFANNEHSHRVRCYNLIQIKFSYSVIQIYKQFVLDCNDLPCANVTWLTKSTAQQDKMIG